MTAFLHHRRHPGRAATTVVLLLGLVGLAGLVAATGLLAQPRGGLLGLLEDFAVLPDDVRVERDLAYGAEHGRQRLDLYLPPGEVEGGRPLIIWIHGGGWMTGDKAQCLALPFLRQGFAVASINYRLSQHAPWPAQIADCHLAVGWLRERAAEFNLDPQRFGAFGASAGGHLSALLGLTSGPPDAGSAELPATGRPAVQAVCNVFGPSDLSLYIGQDGDAPGMVRRLFGGRMEEQPARLAGPLHYARAGAAPMLHVHGDADRLVPIEHSRLLDEALRGAGADSRLIEIEGGGHGGVEFLAGDLWREKGEFFTRHLKSDHGE